MSLSDAAYATLVVAAFVGAFTYAHSRSGTSLELRYRQGGRITIVTVDDATEDQFRELAHSLGASSSELRRPPSFLARLIRKTDDERQHSA